MPFVCEEDIGCQNLEVQLLDISRHLVANSAAILSNHNRLDCFIHLTIHIYPCWFSNVPVKHDEPHIL